MVLYPTEEKKNNLISISDAKEIELYVQKMFFESINIYCIFGGILHVYLDDISFVFKTSPNQSYHVH